MNDWVIVRAVVRPDSRGDAWLRMPFREEGPRDLRIGKAMTLVQDWLKIMEPDSDFSWQIDFTLVTSMQRQLRLIDNRTELSIIDFVHPVWVHDHGTFCSNCDVPSLQFEPEPEDDDAPTDDYDPDDPFAEERLEDLRDHIESVVIEQHADCALCGRDFICEDWQRYLHVVLKDLVYCEDCRAKFRLMFPGPPPDVTDQ